MSWLLLLSLFFPDTHKGLGVCVLTLNFAHSILIVHVYSQRTGSVNTPTNYSTTVRTNNWTNDVGTLVLFDLLNWFIDWIPLLLFLMALLIIFTSIRTYWLLSKNLPHKCINYARFWYNNDWLTLRGSLTKITLLARFMRKKDILELKNMFCH